MKLRQMLALVAAASLMAVSCQKNETFPEGNASLAEGAIGFNAYTGTTTTKGTVMLPADVQTSGIGVFAFYQAAVAEQPVPFNTHKFVTPDFMYNQKVTYADGKWSYTPVKFWPNNVGDRLSFFGYAPYEAGTRWDDLGITTSSNADKLSVTFEINDDVSTQKDLLWAAPSINQTNKLDGNVNNPAKTISFAFKHVTAKVGMMIGVTTGSAAEEWNDANTVILPKSIVLKGLNSQFKYTYPITDGQIDEANLKVDYCDGKTFDLSVEPGATVDTIGEKNWGIPVTTPPMKHDAGIFTQAHVDSDGYYYAYMAADSYMFLAPQAFSDQTVTITYAVKTTDSGNKQNGSSVTNTITNNLKDILPAIGATADCGFEAGKAYNLKFLIGLDDVNIEVSVVDWDADIYEKEIYVPANYTVAMYQGENVYTDSEAVKNATFKDDEDIYVNVRDIDLNDANTGLYKVLDYAADPTSYANLNEALVAKAGTSESDLRLTEITGAIKPEFVTTKSVTFDNATAVIDNAKIGADSVYVFKYKDTPTGAVRYTIFKTGAAADVKTAPVLSLTASTSEVNVGDTLTVIVKEGTDPVSGLRRSSFKILNSEDVAEESAFTIEPKAGVDGGYIFTANLADSAGVRRIIVRGDTVSVKVNAYSFNKTSVSMSEGNTAAVTLKLGNTKFISADKNDFYLTGTTKITVESVIDGDVTLAAEAGATAAADAKLQYKKDELVLAETDVKIVSMSFFTYNGTTYTAIDATPGNPYYIPKNTDMPVYFGYMNGSTFVPGVFDPADLSATTPTRGTVTATAGAGGLITMKSTDTAAGAFTLTCKGKTLNAEVDVFEYYGQAYRISDSGMEVSTSTTNFLYFNTIGTSTIYGTSSNTYYILFKYKHYAGDINREIPFQMDNSTGNDFSFSSLAAYSISNPVVNNTICIKIEYVGNNILDNHDFSPVVGGDMITLPEGMSAHVHKYNINKILYSITGSGPEVASGYCTVKLLIDDSAVTSIEGITFYFGNSEGTNTTEGFTTSIDGETITLTCDGITKDITDHVRINIGNSQILASCYVNNPF